MSVRHPRANQTSRNITKRHVRNIFMQGNQTKQKIFLSRNQFVKCKEFNTIFIVALKTGISSSLHTIILRKQTQTKHPIDLIIIWGIFFLSLGLDTSKQSQSILTLIVQTIVSVVLETFSWQPNKEPLKVSLVLFLFSICFLV